MARVLIVLFDGVQTLDAAGPAEVFAAARSVAAQHYELHYTSLGGGPRTTSSGLVVQTRDLRKIRPLPSDTVIVAGGDEEPLTRAAFDADSALTRATIPETPGQRSGALGQRSGRTRATFRAHPGSRPGHPGSEG